MEASPVGFTSERYWTEEKERALIAFFSSESSLFNHQLFIPQEVSVFTGVLSEGATFMGNRCSTRQMTAASDMV